jgi:hypothetical protein
MPDFLELRARVATAAANEKGARDANRYWREVLDPSWKGPYPKHWCGAFALWALHVGLHCTWLWCMNPRQPGFLGRLPQTKAPQVGDLCYLAEPYQHHGVVVGIGEGAIQTAEGNTGTSPGIVDVVGSPFSRWTAFYSIEPLLREAAVEASQS